MDLENFNRKDGPIPRPNLMLTLQTTSVVMSPLKYYITEVGWSRGVLSASHTLLHHELKYKGMRQAAVCHYDPLAVTHGIQHFFYKL